MQDYPAWFYETPKNTIVVVINDSQTRRSRAISIFKEANRLIAMENNLVQINGNNAFLNQSKSSQKDRIEIVYQIEDEFNPDHIENKTYRLLDYKRYPEKMIIALFGKEGTSFDNSIRTYETKVSWDLTSKNKFSSEGFGSNNVVFYSNWLEAMNHALFNIGHSKSVFSYGQLLQKKNNSSSSILKVSINFIDASFNGIRITHRWIDPKSNRIMIRLEESKNE